MKNIKDRVDNFYVGFGVLFLFVLEWVYLEWFNYNNIGMGVMELSYCIDEI